MKYKRGTGLWDEDHVNDFNAARYNSARNTMQWYLKMEHLHASHNIVARQSTQSHNNNNGLHFSGSGAFERELERRGAQPEKYVLTSTTGAKRVAEMVVLRRQELERQSATAMEALRAEMTCDAPSSWFDEARGPLNPAFLPTMRACYTKEMPALTSTPMVRQAD